MRCCIRWGQRSPAERGVLGVLFSIFTMGNAIGSPTSQHFRSANVSLESSIRVLFW